jgi:hypothetical protein
VEQQQKMIDFPFQHNPKLIEWPRSSTSDSKDKCQMVQPKSDCGGGRQLETNFSSPWMNFGTHKPHFYDNTD